MHFRSLMSDEMVNRLLAWYDANHRVLPWRETRDPYAIWVSEIILQQTRVAQGLDYYRRFLEAFPDVESLAVADQDAVMRVWQGLGYYSRARNMQQAARQVVAMGGFPNTYEGLLYLKGIGPYTAAAIGSFAFGLPVAAIDGNVLRVVSRLFCVEEPVDANAGRKMIEQLVGELLPVDDSAHFNQAMMEFGALQCVPHPDCGACPLASHCLALDRDRVEDLPAKEHHTKIRDRFFHYFFIHDDTSFYLHKRGEGDIWQGLYELPLREVDNADVEETLLPVKSARHVLSHQVIHARLYEQVCSSSLPPREDCIIVDMRDIDQYPLPRLIQILLDGR